jgi:hypothetical protein
MIRRRLAGAVAAVILCAPGSVRGSEDAASVAHARLAFFVGTWTADEIPSLRETCTWLGDPGRHVVCRARWDTPSGSREGLSVFSYRAEDGSYLYHGFRSGGGIEVLEGGPVDEGRSWEFSGDKGGGDERRRSRVRIHRLENGGFRLAAQTARGEGEWSAEEIVHYRVAAER